MGSKQRACIYTFVFPKSQGSLRSHPADHIHQPGPELGDPWAASAAQIPATQPASQSWALTKNPGSGPLRLLKVPKGFTSCSLQASQLLAGPRGPSGRAQGTGVGILAHRQRAGPASGSQATFWQALSRGPCVKKNLAWAPGCHQARGSHDPSDLREDFLEPTVPRLARFLQAWAREKSRWPCICGNDRGVGGRGRWAATAGSCFEHLPWGSGGASTSVPGCSGGNSVPWRHCVLACPENNRV